jgi:hypothetical protein
MNSNVAAGYDVVKNHGCHDEIEITSRASKITSAKRADSVSIGKSHE